MLRWTVSLEGGPRRVNHAAVAIGHKVFSFGGYCSGEDYSTIRQIDVHIFNIVSMRWTKLLPTPCTSPCVKDVPYMRYGHTAVVVGETVYIWGGRNDTEGACNVLFAFDPSKPFLINNGRVNVFGCVLEVPPHEVRGGWKEWNGWDPASYMWARPKTSGTLPARWRDFHSATFIGPKMFVFGGRADLLGAAHSNHEIYCNRIKVFDTESDTWLHPTINGFSPEGRRSHSACELLANKCTICFCTMLCTAETMTWTQLRPIGKGPCCRRRQCCCVAGSSAVLFGGTSPCPDHGMGDDFNLMDHSDLYVLDFAPSLKTLCKLAVIHHGLDQSALPQDIRWELVAMTTNSSISRPMLSSHG
uniref:Kelch domain containing 3 n=1 Tax=Eptatretus burgeri TaxID=7764 RepID=A0A8C4QQ18_EPTBU